MGTPSHENFNKKQNGRNRNYEVQRNYKNRKRDL